MREREEARVHWLPLSVSHKLLSPGNGPRSRDALEGTLVSPLPAGTKGRGPSGEGLFRGRLSLPLPARTGGSLFVDLDVWLQELPGNGTGCLF